MHAFKQISLKRGKKYLKNNRTRRIYTRAIIIRKREPKTGGPRVSAEIKYKYNDMYYYYQLRGNDYHYYYSYKYDYYYSTALDKYNPNKSKGEKYPTPTIGHLVMTAKTTAQKSKSKLCNMGKIQ